MSLFASLYTGASGMLAQSKSTGIISENIANVNTVGYKRSEAAFEELVASASRLTNEDGGPGGVMAHKINRITDQGTIQQTASDTDLAMIGDGFFMVRASIDPEADMLFTRNGAFSEDAAGILRNTSGYVLHGLPVDQDGTLQGSLDDLDSLVPIDIGLFDTQALPTSTAFLSLNLDSSQEPIDPHSLTPAQQLPISGEGVHFARSITMYDDSGTAQDITFEFRHTVGPMAHFTSNVSEQIALDDVLVDNATGPTSGIVAGDTLLINDGVNSLTVDFVNGAADTSINQANTFEDLIDVIDGFTDAGGAQVFEATRTSGGGLLVQAIDPTVTLDITGSSATVLGATGLNFIQDPDLVPDLTYEPDADLSVDGLANPNQSAFPALENAPNVHHWWEMRVTYTPTGGTATELQKGLINFNGDGSFNAQTDANGDAILSMDNLPPGFTGPITLNMANFSQFSGGYNVIASDQNGAGVGTRVGVDIENDGTVLAVFNSGDTVPIYRIPVATFANANGLERVTRTAFRASTDSGDPVAVEAGTGGAGMIQASSFENSNVDVADEFGNLIVSQRAYSLNGQIITAVNEMTQTLSRLKN